MPPRFTYWTIIVDNQATAFRAARHEDLLPTFNRLKRKHPSAVMMWFQNGKLWPSRLDAQDAMLAARRAAERPAPRYGPPRDAPRDRPAGGWGKPRDRRAQSGGGWGKPRDPRAQSGGGWGKPRDPRAQSGGNWGKPRDPRAQSGGGWGKPRDPRAQSGGGWGKPRDARPRPAEGAEQPRDRKWRPGGEHRDTRQKYKDAKKAKWTRFKQRIRQRSVGPFKKKKKDEE